MSCSVLCTNLSASVRLSHLTDLFSACGQIVNSDIEGEGNAHARCLLQFSDASAASMAEMLDGTPLGDMAMRVQSVSYNSLKEAPPLQTPASIVSAPTMGQTSSAPGTTPISTEPVVFTQDDRLLRTIYVGNLSPTVLTEHVIGFLAPIGAAIINIKMCPGGGSATAHAFVEFGCVRHAQMALSLSGTELHGRNVKVGMAENPIQAAGEGTADLRKRELALEKVRLAQERLKMKAMGLAPKDNDAPKDPKDADKDKDSKDRAKSRSRSRSRSKRRHRSSSRRSRSRDRHRRHRRRHRSRSRSRSRRRSGSRSRSMPRFSSARSLNYSRPSGRKKQAVQPANMIWDGFQWIPKPPPAVQQQQQQQQPTAAPTATPASGSAQSGSA